MSNTIAVEEMDAESLTKQLDSTERRQERIERRIAELEEKGEGIPDDIALLSETNRAYIEELRDKIRIIRAIEKLNRRIRRRRREAASTEPLAAGSAVLQPEAGAHRADTGVDR